VRANKDKKEVQKRGYIHAGNIKLKQQRLQFMIKNVFFDKINNSTIVNAFKQLLNGTDREKLFAGIP